ncbi:UNVERIFIED_CONTAM: hypothetical protein Sangu_1014300 [Sesamum angustifolium]|uniref:Uncharacterized protein n=1 Tax=Sesamum angustifolium TaxID=2727405 RepID=A0AAW2PDI5_9LAMI
MQPSAKGISGAWDTSQGKGLVLEQDLDGTNGVGSGLMEDGMQGWGLDMSEGLEGVNYGEGSVEVVPSTFLGFMVVRVCAIDMSW